MIYFLKTEIFCEIKSFLKAFDRNISGFFQPASVKQKLYIWLKSA